MNINDHINDMRFRVRGIPASHMPKDQYFDSRDDADARAKVMAKSHAYETVVIEDKISGQWETVATYPNQGRV